MLQRRKNISIRQICDSSNRGKRSDSKYCTICTTRATAEIITCSNPSCTAQLCLFCCGRFMLMIEGQIRQIPFPTCPCCASPFSINSVTQILRSYEPRLNNIAKDEVSQIKKPEQRIGDSYDALLRNASLAVMHAVIVAVAEKRETTILLADTKQSTADNIKADCRSASTIESPLEYISSIDDVDVSFVSGVRPPDSSDNKDHIYSDKVIAAKLAECVSAFENRVKVTCPECGHVTTLFPHEEKEGGLDKAPQQQMVTALSLSASTCAAAASASSMTAPVSAKWTPSAKPRQSGASFAHTTSVARINASSKSREAITPAPRNARAIQSRTATQCDDGGNWQIRQKVQSVVRALSSSKGKRAPDTACMMREVQLYENIAALVQYRMSPDEFVAHMEAHFLKVCENIEGPKLRHRIKHGLMNNSAAYSQLLSLIQNKTLRYMTSIAILTRYPNLRLKCCGGCFCFTCGSAEGYKHVCREEELDSMLPSKSTSVANMCSQNQFLSLLIADLQVITSRTRGIGMAIHGSRVGSSEFGIAASHFTCSVCMETGLDAKTDLFRGCEILRQFVRASILGAQRAPCIVCKTCALQYISMQVKSTLYTVAPIKCACCGEKLPTAVWQRELKRGHTHKEHNTELEELCRLYARSGDRARLMRCCGCDKTYSIFSQSNVVETDMLSALKKIGATSITDEVSLLVLVKNYAYNQVSPQDFIVGLEKFFLSKSTDPEQLQERITKGAMHSSAKYKTIINALGDVERQGAAYNSLLLRFPKVVTICCKKPFCFTCKISSFHSGQTCAERLRAEASIEAQYCPGCAVPTVLTEGCRHIVCPCGVSWHWQK